MNEQDVVRKYQPADRATVREISWQTADQGRPVDSYFRDHEAAADILTRYYTDWEPQSLWLAEYDHAVVGYLAGCLDTRRYQRVMIWKVIPRAGAGATSRGGLGRAQTWRLIAALALTAVLGGIPRVDLNRYPAHLHINLRQGFRGRGFGRQLIDRFRRQVVERGLSGIHLAARGENAGGRRFFEAMGFRLLREQPLILPEGRGLRKTSTVVYGWTREN